MTNQEYFNHLLFQQRLSDSELASLRSIRDDVQSLLSTLDGSPRFYYAGSYGKRTIIRERYDLDLVVYWPNTTSYTLKAISDGVGEQLAKRYRYLTRKTVSWEIPFQGGFHVDVVPGRALDSTFVDANLYRSDTGTSLKTSIKKHIETVRNGGCRDAIRLMKLWREKRSVPFRKSFLLEIMTIMGAGSTSNLEQHLNGAFSFIEQNIESRRILDPANTNNSLSDDISDIDKSRIRQAAKAALNANNWGSVFG